MISIYHTDPYELFRKGFETALAKFPDVHLIGSRRGYVGLLANLHTLKPDLLITNNYLFDSSKVEMIEKLPELRKAFPSLKVAMLTMADSKELMQDLKDKGLVEAFMLKNMEVEEIYQVLKLLSKGKSWWYYPQKEE